MSGISYGSDDILVIKLNHYSDPVSVYDVLKVDWVAHLGSGESDVARAMVSDYLTGNIMLAIDTTEPQNYVSLDYESKS